MAEPGLVPFLAVEHCRLHVLVLVRSTLRLYLKHLSVAQHHFGITEQGTADIVSRRTRRNRIESQIREDHERRHTATILVSRNTHQVVAEPRLQQLADALLRLPGLTGVIVEIRNMQARFICHRELPHVSGMVGQPGVELVLATPQRFAECTVEVGNELLVAAHQCDEVGHVVRNVPAIYPTVVLAVELAGAHASGVAVVEGFNPLAVLVFGMEEGGLGVVYVAVVVGALQVVGCFVRLAQGGGYAREAPLVVRSAEGDGYRLAFLEGVYVGVCLRLSCLEGGYVSMFLVEVVYPAGGSARPRGECLLFDASATGFVGGVEVELQTFGGGVGYGGYGVVRVHAAGVARDFGEGGHPHVAHLPGHAEVGVDDVFLGLVVDEQAQGVGGAVGVPNPVVGVEGSAVVVVHLAVEGAEVAAVFADADGAFEDAVEGGVEYLLVLLGAARDLDVAQGTVPELASSLGEGLEVVVGQFALEVLAGLFFTDEGDAVAEVYGGGAGGEVEYGAGVASFGFRQLVYSKIFKLETFRYKNIYLEISCCNEYHILKKMCPLTNPSPMRMAPLRELSIM